MRPVGSVLALDNQLCFALYSASRAMTRAYGPLLADLGLTYPQYVTMLALWESTGPMGVGDLGTRLHLDSGTLTPLLKRLEHAGLVTRTRDADDERRVLIALTDAGRDLRSQAEDIPRQLFAASDLDPAELIALRDQLSSLVSAIEPTAG
jgi:DNA-binding MarR family transcriptional regulator